jgi:hypothetical protein
MQQPCLRRKVQFSKPSTTLVFHTHSTAPNLQISTIAAVQATFTSRQQCALVKCNLANKSNNTNQASNGHGPMQDIHAKQGLFNLNTSSNWPSDTNSFQENCDGNDEYITAAVSGSRDRKQQLIATEIVGTAGFWSPEQHTQFPDMLYKCGLLSARCLLAWMNAPRHFVESDLKT